MAHRLRPALGLGRLTLLVLLCALWVAACATSVPQESARGDDRDDEEDSGRVLPPDLDVRPPDDDARNPDDALDDASTPDAPESDTVADAADTTNPPDAAPDTTTPDVVTDTGPAPDAADCRGQGCTCTPVTAATVCGGLPCVDGVCCDSACTGTCQTCALPTQRGRCGFIAAGQDPGSECVDQPAATCGLTGQCDGAGACARQPAGTPCSDGQSCSNDDGCDGAGVCRGTVPTTCGPGAGNECCSGACTDGVGCQTVAGPCADRCGATLLETGGSCSGCGAPGAVGTCTGRRTLRCDAGSEGLCQTATCGGTSYTCTNLGGTWAWRPGGACDDGNLCTHSDSCAGGTCRGTAITCTSTTCTESSCNGTPTCSTTPRVGATCDDGNPCSSNDTCNTSGVCQAGTTTTCTSTPCIDRACNGTGGCTETIRTGATCDDANLCTFGDTCNAAGSCEAGTPIDCSGRDTPCSITACNGTATCATTPRNVGGVCDDANPATDRDVCTAAGVCQGQTGCPPPAEACVAGSQSRDGCANARTINRITAGTTTGVVINDDTCSARDRFDDSSGCFDAGADHTYRLYMRQGETVNIRLQEFAGCVTSFFDMTLKIFENAGCGATDCANKVYCNDYINGERVNYTAPRDGWIIIVADGSTAFDDEGDYRLTVLLTCRDGNCACL